MHNIKRTLFRTKTTGLAGSSMVALWVTACILAIVVLGWLGLQGLNKKTPLGRYTVAVIGNPFIITSYNFSNGSVVAVSIPSTVRIEGIFGYGMYTLESLWKLDRMDKHDGALLLGSLSELIGYPIDAFLDMSTGRRLFVNDIRSDFRDVWTFSHLINAASTLSPSVSIVPMVRFLSGVSSVREDQLQILDFDKISGLINKEDLPDGTQAYSIDTQKLEEVMAGRLEDLAIREERLRIAIYNTTKSEGIGQKAAKTLSTIGIFVVSVSNDPTERTKCLIRSRKDLEHSRTIAIMKYLYSCDLQVTDEVLRSDADIYMGHAFADRFTTVLH